MKNLPIFDIILNEQDLSQGVGVISLVDDPAIKVNWIKMANQSPIEFQLSKDKQLLYGPFLIPNMLIYRNDEINGEYYIRFSAEEIDKIANKFNEDLNSKNINFMHTDQKVDGFVAQNWIIDGEQDKSRNFGFDLPVGTWFGSVKIKDDSFWTDKIKNQEVKGFSVEILADLELSLKNKEEKMKNEIKLSEAPLADGTILYYDGDLATGAVLFTDDAMTIVAEDKEYTLADGTIVVVLNGVVDSITEAAAVADATLAEPVTASLTAEEVSLMIDDRFAVLMEEITALKSIVEGNVSETTAMKAHLSITPAEKSVTKLHQEKVSDKFAETVNRVRSFAKNK